jgi:hypothetical protein
MSLGLVASYGSSSGEESDEEEVSITGKNPAIFWKLRREKNTPQCSVAYPDSLDPYRMFLGLPDPLVRGTDLDPALDPSIIEQK